MKKIITIKKILSLLSKETKKFSPTLIETIIQKYGKNPFIILICCLLSLRSKDVVTIPISQNLLKKAKTPQQILKLSLSQIEKIIFKIGFYRNKAKVLHKVSKEILDRFNNKVPANIEQLLKLHGVGRKTANLVMGLAYNIPSICVDIHVHRISNRLGIIKTKTPEQTEIELKKIIPKKYWIIWNGLLVKWGQNICISIKPKCNQCAIEKLCNKVIKK
ncbi:endonuclease III [Candidatus Babeliales bacterium]|nr:endonuclease III [Candidatus Babeliales bacterium]